MPKTIIEAKGLIKTYSHSGRDVSVLKGIDLTLRAGETVSIVGPSGAGKSTLLYLLGLLENPTEGRLLFDGIEVGNLTDRERSRIRLDRVGFVFQFHHLLPEFTALENIMMPGLMTGKSMVESIRRATGLLDRVGLRERVQHKPGELSGGEQQRVAFGRALMNSPEFILADEPTGNLDLGASKTLEEMMWEICRENDTGILIVTHNIILADHAERTLQLVDGLLNTHEQA